MKPFPMLHTASCPARPALVLPCSLPQHLGVWLLPGVALQLQQLLCVALGRAGGLEAWGTRRIHLT